MACSARALAFRCPARSVHRSRGSASIEGIGIAADCAEGDISPAVDIGLTVGIGSAPWKGVFVNLLFTESLRDAGEDIEGRNRSLSLVAGPSSQSANARASDSWEPMARTVPPSLAVARLGRSGALKTVNNRGKPHEPQLQDVSERDARLRPGRRETRSPWISPNTSAPWLRFLSRSAGTWWNG